MKFRARVLYAIGGFERETNQNLPLVFNSAARPQNIGIRDEFELQTAAARGERLSLF